ncbi:unnamed protein product [Soboliphyme baturini]|uniref:receptor protein serine/threonine kinase n=1 Tax=Soboliphyme baturini TaxID=241478 RepID=A0A183IC98_9BILA|nr:unnamed protein product [Soboliphyme baturini]
MAYVGSVCNVIIVLSGVLLKADATKCKYHISPTLPARLDVSDGFLDSGNVSETNPTIQLCDPMFRQCMTIWQYDPITNDTSVLLQASYRDTRSCFRTLFAFVLVESFLCTGCWKSNGNDCEPEECVAHSDIKKEFFLHSRYCCCSKLLCNENFSYVYLPDKTDDIELLLVDKTNGSDVVASVAVCCVLLLLAFVVAFYLVYRFGFNVHKPFYKIFADPVSAMDSTDADSVMAQKLFFHKQLSQKTQFDSNDIVITDLIARGRYSTVWRAIHKSTNTELSIKIYEQPYGYYYYNESVIFTLPFMNHDNIVPFFGISEQISNPLKYCLATLYMPGGSLQDFLKVRTYDWPAMRLTAVKSWFANSYKPVVVHRDLNSRNILMKQDGTCCLCDFGFAYALNAFKDKGLSDEDVSIAEVGTVRYMAPELLEGAANLTDPQTTLQQVDVYALGLVFWEIMTRCSDIYSLTGHMVPEYRMPYEKEVAFHPTLEQMQLLVCKKKHRPAFPIVMCRQTSGPLRALRELIEDCWDQDCDARITSICAQERLIELCSDSRSLIPNGKGRGSPTKQRIFSGQFQTNGFGQLVRSNVSSQELRRPFYPGESSADTSRTGTSGIGSLSLISTDRGRSSNSSSLGYQTNRSDSPYYGRNVRLDHNTLSEMSGEMTDDHMRASDFLPKIGDGQFCKLAPTDVASGFPCKRDSQHHDVGYLSTYNDKVVENKSARLFCPDAAQDDLFATLLLKCGTGKASATCMTKDVPLPNVTVTTDMMSRLVADCSDSGGKKLGAARKGAHLQLFSNLNTVKPVGGT